MAMYIIYFNQQWVGDHDAAWFRSRGPLARAVVEEMKAAGVHVLAGGLEENIEAAFSAVPTGDTVRFDEGAYEPASQYLGGLTVVDVANDEEAKRWAGKLAQACGWPQEVRRFKP